MSVGARFASVLIFTLIVHSLVGCTNKAPPPPDDDDENSVVRPRTRTRTPEPIQREVRVEGIDGTVFRGELLNGSVTIDSGQGSLTLLTDHVHDITISPEFDTIRSDAVDVSGSIKETAFLLKSDHGVFTLHKDRLRKVEFVSSPAPPSPPVTPAATTPSASAKPTTTNVRPVTAPGMLSK